jgi:hypothetical protein
MTRQTLEIRRALPIAVVVLAVLAGCGPTSPGTASGSPAPSTSTSPTPSSSSPEPTVAPAAAEVAGFELGGHALYSVDADGAEITEYPFADPAAMIAAVTDFYGAPEVVPSGTYCDATFSIWPTEMVGALLIVVYDSGVVSIAVKQPGYVSPTAGPDFGESATAFMASLPPAQVSDTGYVYDPTTAADFGAVAFVDGSGTVTGLASPSPSYGTGFC